MKKMKKLVSVVLAGAMALAMSVSVMATPGITTAEQKILDKAKVEAKDLGVDVNTSKMYKEYVSQASTYLAKNELSQKQIDALVKAVENAAATAKADLEAKGLKSLDELSEADFKALFDKVGDQIVKAAEAVGIKVKKTATGFDVEPIVNDSNSSSDKEDTVGSKDIYIQSNTPIRQTGAELATDKVSVPAAVELEVSDTTTTVVMSVMFVGVVAACVVVAKKKNLFSGVEA